MANKLPPDHHAETIEAFAESVEAMSADEQAMFWRSLAEDAVRMLTVERNVYREAIEALEALGHGWKHFYDRNVGAWAREHDGEPLTLANYVRYVVGGRDR